MHVNVYLERLCGAIFTMLLVLCLLVFLAFFLLVRRWLRLS